MLLGEIFSWFLRHRCPDLYQVPVRIIEADDFLSPAVGHQAIDIDRVRIEFIQPPGKAFQVALLEIELTGIVL